MVLKLDVPPHLHQRLQQAAEKHNTSMRAIVIAAVVDHLKAIKCWQQRAAGETGKARN